jgi:hypothetical protein
MCARKLDWRNAQRVVSVKEYSPPRGWRTPLRCGHPKGLQNDVITGHKRKRAPNSKAISLCENPGNILSKEKSWSRLANQTKKMPKQIIPRVVRSPLAYLTETLAWGASDDSETITIAEATEAQKFLPAKQTHVTLNVNGGSKVPRMSRYRGLVNLHTRCHRKSGASRPEAEATDPGKQIDDAWK